jgi:peptidoglycan/LPS O-acetylase OafA/YrhL
MPTLTNTQATPGLTSKPASGERIVGIDHVRGLAILGVFLTHSLYATFQYDRLGWNGWFRSFHAPASFLVLSPLVIGGLGVAMFFAVSGFCIHLSHVRSSRKDFPVFFVRRFFRIYPPYLLALAIFALVYPLTRVAVYSHIGVIQIGSHLLLLHNFDKDTFFGVNGSFWSIAIEVQLYVLYPLLLMLVQRLGWGGALWLTGVIEIGLRANTFLGVFHPGPHLASVLYDGPLFYWFSWGLGAKLADDQLAGRPLILARWPLWLLVGLVPVAFVFKPMFPFTFTLTALATTCGIAKLLSRPHATLPAPAFLLKHIGQVGVVSYSFYLLHQPIVNLVHWYCADVIPTHFVHPFIKFACCLATYPVILFISWLAYRFVELPSIEFGKWVIRTKMGKGSPANA